MDKVFWNERFSSEEYAYGMEPNDFLVESLKHFPLSGKVLSLAEGEGRNGVFLAQKNFEVTGIDFSREGQKKALDLAEKAQVSLEYILTQISDFEFEEEQWDGIISIFSFLDSNAMSRKSLFEKIIRSLKPGGVFVLEAYHPKQLEYQTGGPKDPQLLITLKELEEAFGSKQFLHAEEKERVVLEGIFHTGKSFVTQVIFQK